MRKTFCDKCGKEMTTAEINYCNEMIGYGDFCAEHRPEQSNKTYTISDTFKAIRDLIGGAYDDVDPVEYIRKMRSDEP